MSDSSSFDFSKFVPGFDFLKKLSGAGASAAVPTASSWIAPTLDPEELDKRIQELKTVHFWLDQNTKAVSATIQALEVQRMTLVTLRGMNLSMNELAESLKIKPETMSSVFSTPSTPAPAAAEPASAPHAPNDQSHSDASPPAAEAATPKARSAKKSRSKTATQPSDTAPAGVPAAGVDPMAWWGSLTQQFQQIAQQAMTDIQRNTPPATSPEATTATASTTKARAKPAAGKGRTAARKSAKTGTRTPRS